MPIEEENMSKKENLKQDKKMIKHGKKIIYSGCAIKVSSRYRKSWIYICVLWQSLSKDDSGPVSREMKDVLSKIDQATLLSFRIFHFYLHLFIYMLFQTLASEN